MVSSRRERVHTEAVRLLTAGVTGHVFPGATTFVSYRQADGTIENVTACSGLLVNPAIAASASDRNKLVVENTIYDLASLTKPLFATICMRLVERGALSLDLKAEQLVPDVRGTVGGSATLEQLLTHRSGMAAWGGLYLDVPHELGSSAARRWIFTEATRRAEEGSKTKGGSLYSDLGYIVAAEIVARATQRDLATHLAKEIIEPLGLEPLELSYPSALTPDKHRELLKRVAPTERDEWRGRMVRGEVHDENCAALGGVSGHAGVFGTAKGIGLFGRAILDASTGRLKSSDTPLLSEATLKSMLDPRAGGTHRLGWDGKSAADSSAGRRMSASTFGHLGFTGTSIWCDPVTDVVVVLLSNRVCPSRANEKIKGFRPAFHDAILAAVTG